MKPYQALHAHLAANAGVSALVGTDIYAGLGPNLERGQAVPTCIVFRRASRTKDAAINNVTLLRRVQFEVVCMAATYAQADSLGEAVIAALDGFRGLMGDLNIKSCHVTDVSDQPDAEMPAHACVVSVAMQY